MKLVRNPNVSEAFCASIIRDDDVDLMTERERAGFRNARFPLSCGMSSNPRTL